MAGDLVGKYAGVTGVRIGGSWQEKGKGELLKDSGMT